MLIEETKEIFVTDTQLGRWSRPFLKGAWLLALLMGKREAVKPTRWEEISKERVKTARKESMVLLQRMFSRYLGVPNIRNYLSKSLLASLKYMEARYVFYCGS